MSYALSGPVPNLEGILKGGGIAPGTILALTPLVGPLGFGWDYDVHGTYHRSLIAAVVMLVVAAGSFMLLGRYRDFPQD